MTHNKLRHLDLFSGIGGFSLGLEATGGFETIGFSEIEPYPCAVLKKHWPKVKNYGDIRTIPAVRCDIVTGGFPCQPFSVAGQQRGAEDDRHLWPAMCAAIAASRPTWCICENVPGIIEMELENCCLDLEEIGYATQPLIIPACSVGARHERFRLFIVANSESKPIFQLPKTCLDSDASIFRLSRPRPCRKSKHNAASPFKEADSFVESIQSGNLPHVCRRHDGFPKKLDEYRTKSIGNSIVPQIAQILGEIILQTYA